MRELVVGGGIMGCSLSQALVNQGKEVILVDAHPQPTGASVRNFGLIATGSIVALEGQMRDAANATYQFYLEKARQGWPIRTLPTVYWAQTEAEQWVLEDTFARLQQTGIAAEIGTVEQLGYATQAAPHGIRLGLRFPNDLSVDPAKLLEYWWQALAQAGVQFRIGKVTPQNDAVLLETGEPLQADRYHFATGAHSLFGPRPEWEKRQTCTLQMWRIRPKTAFTLPYTLATGWSLPRYPVFREACEKFGLTAGAYPSIVQTAGIHLLLKPQADGSYLFGDTHHYAPASHPAVMPVWDYAAEQCLFGRLYELFPETEWTVEMRWQGQYPVHPDRDAEVQRVRDQLFCHTLYGGKGMSTAPGWAEHSLRLAN